MNTAEHVISDWQALGRVPPGALWEARLQLHWAAQVAASVGYTFVAPTPDWSHTSLDWLDGLGAFASQLAPGPPAFRAALLPDALTLLLLDEAEYVHSQYALDGRTLDDAYQWLASAIAAHTGREAPPQITRPDNELPDHPTAAGQAFARVPPAAFAELGRWYANAYRVLQTLPTVRNQAPAIRTWPHHFDMAVLFEFDPDTEAERSIGVGLVPGDESYAEPYWYITPHPVPSGAALPPLDGAGVWRREGWFGAVLTATQLVAAGDAGAQAARAQAFVQSGIAASRQLLGLSE